MTRRSLELLIIDGYNVIRSSQRYRHMIDEAPSTLSSDVYAPARHALISDVAEFAQGTYNPVVVFDGFGNAEPTRSEFHSGSVRIMFSPYGVEADTVIEKLARQEREAGRPVTVVTSDFQVQSTVLGQGVSLLSARMFDDESDELDERLSRLNESPRPAKHTHTTVAQRIDPAIAARLHEMTLPHRRSVKKGDHS